MQLEQGEPHSPEFLQQSERFAEIVREYERQCQVQVCWDGVALCSASGGHLGLRECKEAHLSTGQRDPLLKPSTGCLLCQDFGSRE